MAKLKKHGCVNNTAHTLPYNQVLRAASHSPHKATPAGEKGRLN